MKTIASMLAKRSETAQEPARKIADLTPEELSAVGGGGRWVEDLPTQACFGYCVADRGGRYYID